MDYYIFMDEAIREAKKAEANGDVPVGAVAVFNNEIIGRGYNQKEAENDPSGHAEIAALKEKHSKEIAAVNESKEKQIKAIYATISEALGDSYDSDYDAGHSLAA